MTVHAPTQPNETVIAGQVEIGPRFSVNRELNEPVMRRLKMIATVAPVCAAASAAR